MPTLEESQATVDAAWAANDAVRAPLRAELAEVVDATRGVTGLDEGPGCDRLIDLLLDFAAQRADRVTELGTTRTAALAASEAHASVVAAQPAEPETPPPPALEQMNDEQARAWLSLASDADVRQYLAEVPNTDDQRGWALKLMAWGRADGNQAQVFQAINEFLTLANPADVPDEGVSGGVGATSTFPAQVPASASASDTPVTGDDARESLPEDVDALLAWVGTDPERAAIAHDAELTRDPPRADLIAQLNAIATGADAPAPAPEASPPSEPAPTEAPAAPDTPAPDTPTP